MNKPPNELQDNSDNFKKQSKFTTLRVLKTKRNKIRRIAEKNGLRIEAMTDHLLMLGLDSIQNNNFSKGC